MRFFVTLTQSTSTLKLVRLYPYFFSTRLSVFSDVVVSRLNAGDERWLREKDLHLRSRRYERRELLLFHPALLGKLILV